VGRNWQPNVLPERCSDTGGVFHAGTGKKTEALKKSRVFTFKCLNRKLKLLQSGVERINELT
jgi:hypothetical protein